MYYCDCGNLFADLRSDCVSMKSKEDSKCGFSSRACRTKRVVRLRAAGICSLSSPAPRDAGWGFCELVARDNARFVADCYDARDRSYRSEESASYGRRLGTGWGRSRRQHTGAYM